MTKRTYLGWESEVNRCKARRKEQLQVVKAKPVQQSLAASDSAAVSTNQNPVLLAMDNFRSEGLFCDVFIHTSDGVFPAHKIVLVSASDYFRGLFLGGLVEHQRRTLTNCKLTDITSRIMRRVLNYVYGNQVDLVMHDNITELLQAADYLGIGGIIQLCCDYLAKRLGPHNSVGAMRFARFYKDPRCMALASKAYRYVMENFVSVSICSEGLMKLCVDELRLLLSSDQLNVDNEEYVWECILRWIAYDVKARKKHMRTLLPQVRFGLVAPNFLVEQVRGHPWVESPDCKAVLVDTMRYICNHKNPQASGEATPTIGRPRITHEVLFAIGGWSGSVPTALVEAYNCRNEEWVAVSEVDPSGPRAYHGAAVLGHLVYVIGGFDGKRRYHNSCRCYNTRTKTWSEVAPMNYRRCYISVAVIGHDIYALGGYDGHYRQNTAERYNKADNQWTLIRPMHVQRSDAGAASLYGRIYIAGGFNGVECVASAESYNPRTNQWTMIMPMMSRRSGVGCSAYQGMFYALGGFNGAARLCSGESYDPVTDQWTIVPNMHQSRSNFGVAVVDGMIFVLGGFNGVSTFPDSECLDTVTNTWYKVGCMGLHRSALAACVVEGLPTAEEYVHGEQLKERIDKQRKQMLNFEPLHDI